MEFIHVRNIERYHPSYKDRPLQYAKIFINMAEGDPETETLCEIDFSRLIKIILLELRARKPLPNDPVYWSRKGIELKKRSMSLTLEALRNFVESVTLDSQEACYREEKSNRRVIEEEEKIYVDWEQSTLASWNSFVGNYPILSRIQELSEKRRTKLKKRFEKESFRDFDKILENIKTSPFLLGENQRQWKVTFDWLIENDTNYLKVVEGRYLDKKQSSADDTRKRLGLKE